MNYKIDNNTNTYNKTPHDPRLLNLFVPNINETTPSKLTKELPQNDYEISISKSTTDSPQKNYVVELKNALKEMADLEQLEQQEQTITALVPTKQYTLINPMVVYKVKKSIKLSIRSFLLSLSLTILNLFI